MNKPHQTLSHAFGFAFGISDDELAPMSLEMQWLFERRDMAAHAYTELVLPKVHPLGLNTGVENVDFNALTSGRGVDLAMRLLETAAAAPKYHNRWLERWSEKREPYTDTIVPPLKFQRAEVRSRICKDFKPVDPDGTWRN